MVRFERRFFPARRYRLPVRWVLLGLAAGLLLVVLLVFRRLL